MDPMQFVGEPAAVPAAASVPPAGQDPLAFIEQAAAPAAAVSGGGFPTEDLAQAAPVVPAAAAPLTGGGGGGFDAGAFDGLPLASGDGAMGMGGGAAVMGGGGGSAIPEPTKLREWEDAHERKLEDYMRQEEQNRKERKDQATKEIQDWYNEQKAAHQKRAAHNRTEEKEFLAMRDAGLKGNLANPWDRVVTLIDTNTRAGQEKDEKDLGRMKNLMIQLKANPPAAA